MRSLLLVFVFQLAQSGTLRGDYEPDDPNCDTRLIETPPTRSIKVEHASERIFLGTAELVMVKIIPG